MTTTSSSNRLLQNLTVSKPALKLMVAALQGHLSKFSDGGLYCGLLMTGLVETCSSLDVHPVLCSVINEHVTRLCLELLDSLKIPVNVADVNSMINIVRTVVDSKPLCNLTVSERDHVCSLVLQAFLKTLPVDSPNNNSPNTIPLTHIELLSVEGFPTLDSRVIEGVLLERTKFMTVTCEKNAIPQVHSGLREGQIRVALYDISMAGDSQDFVDVNYELLSDISIEDIIVAEMTKIAEKFVADDVGIVACQKVIHPSLKKFLNERGVWTLDRLSRIHIDAVQKITGMLFLLAKFEGL